MRSIFDLEQSITKTRVLVKLWYNGNCKEIDTPLLHQQNSQNKHPINTQTLERKTFLRSKLLNDALCIKTMISRIKTLFGLVPQCYNIIAMFRSSSLPRLCTSQNWWVDFFMLRIITSNQTLGKLSLSQLWQLLLDGQAWVLYLSMRHGCFIKN